MLAMRVQNGKRKMPDNKIAWIRGSRNTPKYEPIHGVKHAFYFNLGSGSLSLCGLVRKPERFILVGDNDEIKDCKCKSCMDKMVESRLESIASSRKYPNEYE